jgi:hypothetical protein
MDKMIALMLIAVLEVMTDAPAPAAPLWIRCILTNEGPQTAEIVNPETGGPPAELNWDHSPQAYRMAVLMSYGIVALRLTDTHDRPVESKGLVPWVTPILGRRVLAAKDKVTLDFDLHEFFTIGTPGRYRLGFKYRDGDILVEAQKDIDIGRSADVPAP